MGSALKPLRPEIPLELDAEMARSRPSRDDGNLYKRHWPRRTEDRRKDVGLKARAVGGRTTFTKGAKVNFIYFVFLNRHKRTVVVAALATAQLALGQVSSGAKPQLNRGIRSSFTSDMTPEPSKSRWWQQIFTTLHTAPPRPGSKLPTMFINDIAPDGVR